MGYIYLIGYGTKTDDSGGYPDYQNFSFNGKAKGEVMRYTNDQLNEMIRLGKELVEANNQLDSDVGKLASAQEAFDNSDAVVKDLNLQLQGVVNPQPILPEVQPTAARR